MKRIFVFYILLIVAIMSATAQTSTVQLSIPISGELAVVGNLRGTITGIGGNQLILVNTGTGDAQILSETDRTFHSPAWRPDGESLAFSYASNIRRYDFFNQTSTDIMAPPEQVQNLQDWSLTGANLLNHERSYNPNPPSFVSKLEIISADTGATINTLLTYSNNEIITDIPLHSDINVFKFQELRQARWNPIHPEWIVIQLSGYDDTVLDPTSGYPSSVVATYLYNTQTGQKLSLDALFTQHIVTTDIQWDATGEFLVLQTDLRPATTEIVRFTNTSGNWNLQAVKHAFSNDQVVFDWLGVSDLLLTYLADSDESTVHISQIIQGSWYTAEFLRFPSEQFERSRQSAWNSKVTAEQSYAISCLFDQAQPKRLSVGTVAQVALPNGTPLNLRTAPDANAPAITQLAGGTQLNIIGGPACFNGDLYSRFWQVQLADGTIGWAPEADTIAYFMQIFIPPTATPTDTATFTPTNTHTPSPTFTPSMTPTPVPGSSWLVFVSNRPTITGGPNLWNIYAADDNHYLVRLTDNTTTAVIKQPVWSPDHLSIAYSRKDGADEDLCILTVSTQSEYCGFAINTLSPNVRNREPAWSPDGQTLAYVTEATNGTSDIYKISLTDLTSGNGRGINLTPGDQNGDSRHPDWRYDGLWIAFSSTRDAEGNAEIYIMPSSGGTPQKMTSTGVNVDNNLPAWSPNGNKIAYNSDYLTDAKHDVVIRNITDSDPSANTTWSFTSLTNLTQNRAGNYRFTAWKKSDTGQNKVAIVRGEDLARQIYLVTLNPLDIDPAPWNTSVAEDDPDW